MKNPFIVRALKAIAARRKDGLLLPEEVVKAAEPKSSPLHTHFCWDDDHAAKQYRLWQARELIRTTVETISVGKGKRDVRVFVSLTPDREAPGGGYRQLVDVMSNKGARELLLQDALAELRSFEDKYRQLKELAEVFTASRRLRKAA